jgi:SAM-dependent methyltransferase
MEDAQLLAEVHRVLKPGGTLWLSTTGQFFTIFPGGAVERRLFRSWGHVRRGYSVQMFLERLPEGLRVAEIFEWNELFFRSLYIPLKGLSQLLPSIVYRLLNLIAACDALHRKGESGHLFIRAVRID